MTMADNIKFSKHKEIKGLEYKNYDNYDAIEVPYTDAIPSDYEGVMGVPIRFLDKYCPEQFEILGMANSARWICYNCYTIINGKKLYNRIIIKKKKEKNYDNRITTNYG